MLITGLSFAALIFGMWGLGVLVVRNQTRKLKAAPGAELTEQIGETVAEVHSIEEFIARAGALPEGQNPSRARSTWRSATRSSWRSWPSTTSRTWTCRTRTSTWSASPAWRSGCWPGSRTTPACRARSSSWTS